MQVIGRIRAVHLPIVISRPSICRYSADIRLVLDWAGRALGAGRAYTGWELSSSPRVYINCAPIACTTKGSVWSVGEHLSIFFFSRRRKKLSLKESGTRYLSSSRCIRICRADSALLPVWCRPAGRRSIIAQFSDLYEQIHDH